MGRKESNQTKKISFIGILQVLKFLEILNFHPWTCYRGLQPGHAQTSLLSYRD